MAEPNGKLVTPTGFNPSGVLRALELDVNDYLLVTIAPGAFVVVPHNLLDGLIAQDTLAGNVLRGDIVVGNTTPKWARVAKGASGTILSANATDTLFQTMRTLFNQGLAGVAFPGGPSAGDVFFRTDLGLLCYFDGTRWLTTHEYGVSLPGTLSAVDTTTLIARVRADYAPYFTRMAVTTNVATLNNGTNYWSVSLRGYNAAFAAATEIYAFTTAADAVATYVEHDSAASTAVPANNHFFAVSLTKTLAPGSISIYVQPYYRLIVT